MNYIHLPPRRPGVKKFRPKKVATLVIWHEFLTSGLLCPLIGLPINSLEAEYPLRLVFCQPLARARFA